MRLLTWNINSIRTLAQYHPWNSFKSHEHILNHLESDIICFQEVKSTRASLPKHIAIPESYSSFFSFPALKGGYSGVAVYTKNASVVPIKAEEGLTGILQPKSPLSDEERVSTLVCYPPYALESQQLDYKTLDSEGRTLTLDFGLFVLINVYCPNDTGSEERLKFKTDFHMLLKERVRLLTEVEKRQVIVVGDLNACAAVEDHCEGEILVRRGKEEGMEGEEGFFSYEPREWLRSWLISDSNPAGLVDITRHFWPGRKGMYTCWNTRLSARDSNYGTRIDYILITPGLLPWIKASDIQPKIKGSDHCPVYIDFHDEIKRDDGQTIKLKDFLQCCRDSDPPRLAANNWDEYSGKQRVLDTFFSKKITQESLSQSSCVIAPSLPKRKVDVSDVSDVKRLKTSPLESSKKQGNIKSTQPKQARLSGFFSDPKVKGKAKAEEIIDRVDVDPDFQLALSLSQETESTSSPNSSQSSDKSMSESWSSILAPLKPPLCTVHQEPAKELKVTKKGANKGKGFWICSRPLGPGYDKGRAERPREEVDPRWRCNFFKWSSDVKKEMMKSSSNRS